MNPTDKIQHGYGPTYERLAMEYPTGRLVEIGIGDGAGLYYFRDIRLCSEWVGVDIDLERVEAARRLGFEAHLAEQTELNLRARIGEPTVIVDDASHRFGATTRTFANLWPTVRPGGCYIIEDWSHLEYGPAFRQWFDVNRTGPSIVSSIINDNGLMVFYKRRESVSLAQQAKAR